jgi:hypothetical protein
MTVQELRWRLYEFPDDAQVRISDGWSGVYDLANANQDADTNVVLSYSRPEQPFFPPGSQEPSKVSVTFDGEIVHKLGDAT